MAVFMMVILVGVSLCGVIYAGALPMRDLLHEAGIEISLVKCCWIMGVLAAAYVAAGGLKACAWADLIQGTALIIGGAFITYFAFQALGVADVTTLTAGVGATTAADAAAPVVTAEMGAMQRFFALNTDKLHMFLPKTDTIIPWTALCLGLWIPNLYYWGLNQYITQRTLGSSSLAEGQKGIVFAASLKLIIPFIIVFPGLIAFNLYRPSMVTKAEEDFVKAYEKVATAKAESSYMTFKALDGWKAQNPEKAAEIEAFNVTVVERAAKAGKKTTEKAQAPYKADSALGLLISKLCMGKKGLFGCNKKATLKQLVGVGRICVGVFVVIGCVVAPLLDDPKFGGIFNYIQEFQGYVSPGVLAVFIFGLLNRTAAGMTGVVGLLLNPVLYFVLKTKMPQLDFLNRMAVCMVIVLAVMAVMGQVCKLPKPVEFHSNTHLNLETSKGARIGGIAVVIVTAILYVIFR
jgi:SSS family solute:Na+ symporter